MNTLSIPLLAVIAAAPFAHALDATDWRFTQTVETKPGALAALDLPDATLDAASPTLSDLRLTGASGIEIPYVLDASRFSGAGQGARVVAAKNFSARLEPGSTILTFETGLTESVTGLDLQTPAETFLKPVRVETSIDGSNWKVLAENLPVFRQKNGAENLRLNLPAGPRKFLRVTVDDGRADPSPFTGVLIHSITQTAARDERSAVPATIVGRTEKPGRTILEVDLGAANLPLSGLTLVTPEALFTRRVTVAYERRTETGTTRETLAYGSVWNISGLGGEPSSQKRLAFEALVPTRRLFVTIENGDSPPLAITGIAADRRPRRLLFIAPEGPVTLLSGNPRAAAPRHDLALLAEKIKAAPATPAFAGALNPNPGYKPYVHTPAPAPFVPGAPIDTAPWKASKKVAITAAGAQRLDTDLETLCHARHDLGDLRLVSGGTQVPYLAQRAVRDLVVPVKAVELPPGKSAGVTRHRLELPPGSPPVTAIDFQTERTGEFTRPVRLVRETETARDGVLVETLATGVWGHTANRNAPDKTFKLRLTGPLAPARADARTAIVLEVDNGSDAPVTPFDFRIHLPVTTLRFTAPASGDVRLYFANPGAVAPDYADLRATARSLLEAPASTAALGPLEGDTAPGPLRRHTSLILWVSLAAVVAGLLFAVSKMLPKPDGNSPR